MTYEWMWNPVAIRWRKNGQVAESLERGEVGNERVMRFDEISLRLHYSIVAIGPRFYALLLRLPMWW
jgi:hypothetical protein